MSNIHNIRSDASIDDSDIYTTVDSDLKNMKDVNISDDDLSIPTSTFTEELFSSTKDEDEEMEDGVRKLPPIRRRQKSFCCICQRVVTPIVLLTFVILALIYYFGDSSMFKGIIPGTDMLFANEDLGEQFVWTRSNSDGGLSLEVVNALDTEWQTYFDVSVYDWDNGTPDALTLSTEVANAPDPNCTMIQGVLKMCNSDYGATDWMGVNEVLKFDNEIAGSIGMMNDHFFNPSSWGDHAKRQYTMCHEMGHGFGLPHTDTTMWNRNKGNCLDYTNRPKNNMRPGQVNYDRLVEVYGIVGNTASTTTNATTSEPSTENVDNGANTENEDNTNISTSPPTEANDGNNPDNEADGVDNTSNETDGPSHQNEGKDNNDEKDTGARRGLTSNQETRRPIPDAVMEQLRQVRQDYYYTTSIIGSTTNRRRYLGTSAVGNDGGDGSVHYNEIDLGSGYTVQIQFLKAF